MRAKGPGCLFLGAVWFLLVMVALIGGEPTDPTLAVILGNAIWMWPIFSIGVIAFGGLLHWGYGIGEKKDFRADDNFDRRRSKSGVTGLAAVIVLMVIALGMLFGVKTLIVIDILAALFGGGIIALIVKIADGAQVDRDFAGDAPGAEWEDK